MSRLPRGVVLLHVGLFVAVLAYFGMLPIISGRPIEHPNGLMIAVPMGYETVERTKNGFALSRGAGDRFGFEGKTVTVERLGPDAPFSGLFPNPRTGASSWRVIERNGRWEYVEYEYRGMRYLDPDTRILVTAVERSRDGRPKFSTARRLLESASAR